MRNEKGNIALMGLIFIAIALCILLLVIAIFLGHVNNVLYTVKLNMYSINRSAIIAVNKNKANIDLFSYNKNAYKQEFIKALKLEYELDEYLSNDEKLISNIYIDEFEIYNKGTKDSYTRRKIRQQNNTYSNKGKNKTNNIKDIIRKDFYF